MIASCEILGGVQSIESARSLLPDANDDGDTNAFLIKHGHTFDGDPMPDFPKRIHRWHIRRLRRANQP